MALNTARRVLLGISRHARTIPSQHAVPTRHIVRTFKAGARQAGQNVSGHGTGTSSLAILAAGGAVGLFQLYLNTQNRVETQQRPSTQLSVSMAGPGSYQPKLKTYTMEEVAKHKSKEEGGVWVTFKDGVYDITHFAESHPGGSKILLAAGGSIEPFWNIYAEHKQEAVFAMLEKLRIGNVDPASKSKAPAPSDPYGCDPCRHPALAVHTQKPFNAEAPVEMITDTLVTPTDLFYVRNHLPVPQVEEQDYSLQVLGGGSAAKAFTLSDLKGKFKEHTVTVTLQCAGNRRSGMKKTRGTQWRTGAISTAKWTGVRLRDVLLASGLKLDDDGNPIGDAQHIHFIGLDTDPTKDSYASSIPIEKALNPQNEVLLAYEMNGEELNRDHGYPLRVVVPGVIGGRSVKWLGKIVVAPEESQSFWQQKDYKSFGPTIESFDNVDYSKAPAIQECPVQSAICEPSASTIISAEDDEVTVKGYAYSGGGRGIIRVDVSADGGKTWHVAKLSKLEQKQGQEWAWTHWSAFIPVPEGHTGSLKLCCKAVDTSYNTQPETVEAIWNVRGLVNNAWHKVEVPVSSE